MRFCWPPRPVSSRRAFHTGVVKFKWISALVFCVALQAENITPHIGYIEVYGAHKSSEKKIRSALGLEEGGVLLASPEELENRVNKVSGVITSSIEAVCCDGKRPVLYVGVEEKNTPHFDFHATPDRHIVLPKEMVDSYHSFLDDVAASMGKSGQPDEDLTHGYSLMADPDCRDLQQSFIGIASRDLSVLDEVIRKSDDPEQRAIAAYILQYTPRNEHSTKTMVNALQYALQDPDSTVRANAMRSLKAIAVGARLHPEQHIELEPTWFIELMNSVLWSDRRNASLALVNLTDKRDPASLELIRERALQSVVEMARWHDLKHALPGFILAGRVAGLTDKQIETAWVNGDREAVIQQTLKFGKSHPKKNRLTSMLN